MTRLNIKISLSPSRNTVIPVDYHSNIMSLLKYAINTYDPSEFQRLFGKNTMKFYTWSVNFKNAKFIKDRIYLSSNNFELQMSFYKDSDAIMFQKALLLVSSGECKLLFGMHYTITSVIVKNGYHCGNSVVVKTMSNIACEDYPSGASHKAYFMSLEDGNKFFSRLREVLLSKAKLVGIKEQYVHFESIKSSIVYNTIYGAKLPVTRGTFIVTGNDELVNLALNGGIGTITGSGFGMVRPVNMV